MNIRLLLKSLPYTLTIMAIFLFASSNASEKKEELLQNLTAEVKQGSVEIKNMARQLDSIQRDQLNYKIEKDLLKEAYGSNLQSINIIITIVFGIFGIIGYLGVRSIKEIRTDYLSELEKMRTLKNTFETELDALRNQLREFESKFAEIAKINDSQDRRLKVMEIVEKIGTLIKSKSFKWALEHAEIGLALDPENVILLSQKTYCLGKIARLPEAIVVCKQMLSLEPENLSHVKNLLEFLALSGNEVEFEEFYEKHKKALESNSNGDLIAYFRLVISIVKNNLSDARDTLLSFAKSVSPDATKRLDNWSFDDSLAVAATFNAGTKKQLLLTVISYFKGDSSLADLEANLEAQET